MSKYTYFTPVERLTKADIVKENLKAIALSIVIGVGFGILLAVQLSK